MDFALARRNMVESQIRANRVTDPLLVAALSQVPREVFLPRARRELAYADEAIPVDGGRYILEPLALARLLQAACIKPSDVVLDIGCATGYASAVASRVANTVVALESDPELAASATRILAEGGFDSVVVVEGPLQAGYPRQAPYDTIFIGGAVAEVPPAILDQLADGGRLAVIVQKQAGAVGQGTIYARNGSMLTKREIFDLGAPFLPGFEPRPTFVF